MEELKEFVVTRTYTVGDIIQLLGEGKRNVKVRVGIPLQNFDIRWVHNNDTTAKVIQIEIREPIDEKSQVHNRNNVQS